MAAWNLRPIASALWRNRTGAILVAFQIAIGLAVLVNGIALLLEADIHEPVNLGNPDEMSLLDLARRILALTGSKSPIVYRPLPEDDPKVRRPDIGRAREVLRWEPRVGVDEGLRLTVDDFRRRLAPTG